VKGKVIP